MSRKMRLQQKICGVIVLLLCLALVLITSGGETVEERDNIAVIFLAPLGFYLIFTRKQIMYDLPTAGSVEPAPRRPVGGDEQEASAYVVHR